MTQEKGYGKCIEDNIVRMPIRYLGRFLHIVIEGGSHLFYPLHKIKQAQITSGGELRINSDDEYIEYDGVENIEEIVKQLLDCPPLTR